MKYIIRFLLGFFTLFTGIGFVIALVLINPKRSKFMKVIKEMTKSE